MSQDPPSSGVLGDASAHYRVSEPSLPVSLGSSLVPLSEDDLWGSLRGMCSTQRVAKIADICNSINTTGLRMEDYMITLDDGLANKIHLTDDEHRFLRSACPAFFSFVSQVRQRRSGVDKAITNLRTRLLGMPASCNPSKVYKRTASFWEYLQQTNDGGKTRSEKLVTLFRTPGLTPRNAICLVNEQILKRNLGHIKKGELGHLREMILGDITAAKAEATKRLDSRKGGYLTIEGYKASELRLINVTFHPSGVLKTGQYTEGLEFPTFDDEPIFTTPGSGISQAWHRIPLFMTDDDYTPPPAYVEGPAEQKNAAVKSLKLTEIVAGAANKAADKTAERADGQSSRELRPKKRPCAAPGVGPSTSTTTTSRLANKKSYPSANKRKRYSSGVALDGSTYSSDLDDRENQPEVSFPRLYDTPNENAGHNQGQLPTAETYVGGSLYDEDTRVRPSTGNQSESIVTSLPPHFSEGNCGCVMDGEVLELLNGHNFNELGFREQKSILSQIVLWKCNPSVYHIPCSAHLTIIAAALSLVRMLNNHEMAQRLAVLSCYFADEEHPRRIWIHPHVARFFVRTPEISKYRLAHWYRGERYHMSEPESIEIPPAIEKATGVLSNLIVRQNMYSWLNYTQPSKKGGINIGINIEQPLVKEIEMLRYHYLNTSSLVIKDGALPMTTSPVTEYLGNSHHSMINQLLWADPKIWMDFRSLLPGNPDHLVAIPQPIMYTPAGYDEHFGQKRICPSIGVPHSDARESGLIWGEILLSGESRKVDHIIKITQPNGRPAIDDNGTQLEKTVEHTQHQFDMIYLPYNTVSLYDFRGSKKLNKARIVASIVLVPVGSDGESTYGGFPSLTKLREMHANRTDSFGDPVSPCQIRMPDFDLLNSMIRASLSPDDPAVRTTLAEWSTTDFSDQGDGCECRVIEWRKLAASHVTSASKTIEKVERSLFEGDKSFFRARENNVLSPPNPDLIVSAYSASEVAEMEPLSARNRNGTTSSGEPVAQDG